MATDSAGGNADLTPLGWAYVFTWGGVAAGSSALRLVCTGRPDRAV